MITNVIAFLSSIATAIFIGICIVSINIKYKNNLRRKDLAGFFTRLANISNTYPAFASMSERFSNLQATYYIYKQNHGLFITEQKEYGELIVSLKKLLHIALAIWAVESWLIIFSGRNIFEYIMATAIIVLLVVLFIKFSGEFKKLISDFALGESSFPNPLSLLDPLSTPEKNDETYVSQNMPLNLMEAGTIIELEPPKDPLIYKQESAQEEEVDDEALENPFYDFSHFEANGRLLFAFPYKFTGQLHFYDKHGDDNNPFPVSSDYFKAGFSHLYDIGFAYHTPVHLLEKIVLYIEAKDDQTKSAQITFIIQTPDELPDKPVTLMQATAIKI